MLVLNLGISSRGLGSVKESMGSTVVQEDFELICFDIVSEPSTPNAFVYPKEQGEKCMKTKSMKPNKILLMIYLRRFWKTNEINNRKSQSNNQRRT